MKNVDGREIIKNSNVIFGTSGARGLVSDFSFEVCAAFTANFLKNASERFSFTAIAIAIDNRPSSYEMAQACAALAESLGYQVRYFGVLPTPALALYAMQKNIPAIMVTGSHIPFERNGLKFYHPDGEITKKDEHAIIESLTTFTTDYVLPAMTVSDEAAENYIQRYHSFFEKDCLKGIRLGIYEHSSAGRDIYSRIFGGVGAEVVSLGRTDTFVPIDTEAVSEIDKKQAIKWVADFHLDALFSTDGDGDRPLLSDESGNWLRGDILGLLCSLHLQMESVVTPISSNSLISDGGFFQHTELTKIGSPYVIENLNKLASEYEKVCGFEANGGYLLGSSIRYKGTELAALPTRDAVLPALVVLASKRKMSIFEQVQRLPARFTASDRLQGFTSVQGQHLFTMILNQPEEALKAIGLNDFKIVEINQVDGIRMVFDNRDIIHFRMSGNAPELRCYSESLSVLRAEELVRVSLGNIKKI